VDSQVDDLLRRADQTLTEAAQTTATDTQAVHTALLAEVDLAINQAGEMVEEAEAEAEAAIADTQVMAHTGGRKESQDDG
jgi:hypothetical protein